jgi:hypothetical protein
MTDPEGLFVGIVVARRCIAGRWPSVEWRPRQILMPVPQSPPWTVLEESETETVYYAGSGFVAFERVATSYYGDNLLAAVPSVWVVLRREDEHVAILDVTVDPYEGEGYMEGLDTIVEAVAMPPELASRVRNYYDNYHVEAPRFVKRERDKPDLEVFGRRRTTGRAADEQ